MCSQNIKRYKDLGYVFNNGDIIDVKIDDVPKNSHVYVNVKCDKCHKEYILRFDTYNKTVDDGKLCCNKCAKEKRILTNIKRYNCDNPMKVKEFKEKQEKTLMKNYGVKVPAKNKKILDRMHKTCIEKYGAKSPLENTEIREKAIETNNDRLGVDYPFQSKEIQDKINNCGIHSSKQQIYLCKLYNAINNYNVKGFFIDGLIENNIAMEYDGTGHNLSVVMGKISEEEFLKRESYREKCLIDYGYKILRLKSTTDILPSDKILIDILSVSKSLYSEGYDIVRFDLDKNTYNYE